MRVFKSIFSATVFCSAAVALLAIGSCGREGNTQGQIKGQSNLSMADKRFNKVSDCEDVLSDVNVGYVHLKTGDSLSNLVANSKVDGVNLTLFFEEPKSGVTILDKNVQVIVDTDFGSFTINNIVALDFQTSQDIRLEGQKKIPLNQRFLISAVIYARPQVSSLQCLKGLIDHYENLFESFGFELEAGKRIRAWSDIISIFSETRLESRLNSYAYSQWVQGDIGLTISVTQLLAPKYLDIKGSSDLYNIEIIIWNKKMDLLL